MAASVMGAARQGRSLLFTALLLSTHLHAAAAAGPKVLVAGDGNSTVEVLLDGHVAHHHDQDQAGRHSANQHGQHHHLHDGHEKGIAASAVQTEAALSEHETRSMILGNASEVYKKMFGSDAKTSPMWCDNWCVECANTKEAVFKDGSEPKAATIHWKIERAQEAFHKFATGVAVVGFLAAVGLTGGAAGVFAPAIAGAIGTVGMYTGGAVVAGTLSAGMVVKDLLAKKRDCPKVKFHELIEGNGFWSKKAEEEEIDLEDVNRMEMLFNIHKGRANPRENDHALDSPRTEGTMSDDQARLMMVLSCNMLTFYNNGVGLQAARMNKEHTRSLDENLDGDAAITKSCARWLCGGPVKEVKKMTKLIGTCGGRWR